MSSTRAMIFDYLRRRGPTTAEELAHALELTSADVRHHLANLAALSLVEVVGQRKGSGRGRPRKVYSLSSSSLGDNLEVLTETMLLVWLEGIEEEQRATRMYTLAWRLAGGEKGGLPGWSTLSLRLKQAVERLNELNYQARWEASASGPRLLLNRCPYRNLAKNYPELCEMDAFLLTILTGRKATPTARRERNWLGVPVCVFLLGAEAPE